MKTSSLSAGIIHRVVHGVRWLARSHGISVSRKSEADQSGGSFLRLRPHHLIDIIRSYGHGAEFKPHPYGHALHAVAAQVLANSDLEIELVLAADDICGPCRHLQADGRCDDVLHQLTEPVSKQAYNDDLDTKLFPLLGFRPGDRMTVRAFLIRLRALTPGIEALCTHPGESMEYRLRGIEKGLLALEIRR